MSRYRIVIRAFTLRRDIAAALLLARLLERAGCHVIVASSRDFLRTIRYWSPAAVLDLWDRASFARARLREPLHPNFSYHQHFHTTPAYFDRIVENILAERSILN